MRAQQKIAEDIYLEMKYFDVSAVVDMGEQKIYYNHFNIHQFKTFINGNPFAEQGISGLS